MIFAQTEMGLIETATKLYGPWGAVMIALVIALVYVFRLYHAETRARIEDAKQGVKMTEELIPYLSRLARRIERLTKDADSDPPPPPISRARIAEKDTDQ